MKFLSLLIIFVSFNQIKSIIIECDFQYNFYNTYQCIVKPFNVSHPEEIKVTSIIGHHLDANTNYKVGKVKIENMEISKIPQGLKKFFPSLKELEISKTNLSEIKQSSLEEFGMDLEKISLWFNKISKISKKSFQSTSNLTEIILWGNLIEKVERGAFDGLKNLEVLDLDENICTNAYVYYDKEEVLNLIKEIYRECGGKTTTMATTRKN